MSFRLLATDLDGTLLDANGRVHPTDREALLELGRRGVHVTVCTGRLYSGTAPAAREVGVTGPVACIDGSHVVATEDDRELALVTISERGAETLRAVLGEVRHAAFVFSGDEIHHDSDGEEYLAHMMVWSRRVARVGRVLDSLGPRSSVGAAALVALGDPDAIADALTLIRDCADAELQAVPFELLRPSGERVGGIVVRAAGATKGTALEHIAAHYGVAMEEVVAVGDWLNDVPMLEKAGVSFAMGQAVDEVKRRATFVLEATSETGGGVREAARRAGLL